MGMFDVYEPVPALRCGRCRELLEGWQGKDGPCQLWIWRQGERYPIGQASDPEWRTTEVPARLPERFVLYASCGNGHPIEAEGEAPDGLWVRTWILTPPIEPTLGTNGRWACPCCGCFTLEEEPPGTFAICPVCWWEDDRTQFEDPSRRDGANRPSLSEARRCYLREGVADPDHAPHVRAPAPEEEPVSGTAGSS